MIAFGGTFHILSGMVVHPCIKGKELYLISEYLIPLFALYAVYGQKECERLLKRKSSFQNFIFL